MNMKLQLEIMSRQQRSEGHTTKALDIDMRKVMLGSTY